MVSYASDVLKRKWIDTSFSAKQKIEHGDHRAVRNIGKELKDAEKYVKEMIREAQHFVLPSDSDGEAVIKGYDGDYSDVLNADARLPYPTITVSFQYKHERKFVVVREEIMEGKTLWVMFIPKVRGKRKWETPLASVCVDLASPRENRIVWLSETYGEGAKTWEKGDELKQACLDLCTEEVYAVYELIIRLQTHEVEVKNHDFRFAPQVRVGEGRKVLPVHEYRELVIKPVVEVKNDGGGFDCLPSTSKREHQRRGHQRHLKSGKIIWVKDCIVGDRSKGVIVKEYKLGGEYG